jgi:NAD(P)H-dependent FMN reductase
MTSYALNVALITGSTRKVGPPLILHPRVNTFIQSTLEKRGHNVTRVDPVDFPLLDKPHFVYATGKAPDKLQEVHGILSSANCYVCITPEYNHSPSPGLLNVLNHFGSSTFSFKPSAIGKF